MNKFKNKLFIILIKNTVYNNNKVYQLTKNKILISFILISYLLILLKYGP